MRSYRGSRLALLAGLVCLAWPAHADAQIGGFVKKKLKQAVAGDKAADTKAAPEGPVFDDVVLQITGQNLDRVERALAAEKAFRDSVKAAHARIPTSDQYDKCRFTAMQSPEGRALSATPPRTPADMQRVQQQLESVVVKRCGENPNSIDTSQDLRPAEGVGAAAAGLKPQQYAVLKERILPFCESGGSSSKVPGATREMFYVYTADEMAALQPRCSKLMGLLATGGGAGPKFEGDVVELTPDFLTRFEQYHAALDAYADTMKVLAAKAKPRKEWDACAQQYMMGEGQAMMQQAAMSGKANNPQAMAETMKNAVEKQCGPDPRSVRTGASAARSYAEQKAGVTSGQVSAATERIYAVCSTVQAEPGKPFSARMQRMYTATELKALPPRCGRLVQVIDKHQGNAPQQ